MQAISTIPLRAIHQCWEIQYTATTSAQLRATICPGTQHKIMLYGAIHDQAKVKLWLKKWLKQKAEQHLIPWLQDLSMIHQLPINKVTIRSQRTLWGSCNHLKNISLNCKLLFMPPEYAQHVMLHELCHTKHLNHSKRFWNLLQNLDPNTKLIDKKLLRSEHFIPQEFALHTA